MPDISMCMNKECKIKNTCYRYLTKPSEPVQTYSEFESNGYECKHFIEFREWVHLIIVLKKMCEIANVKYEDIDLKEEEWYLKHTWNSDQEHKFIKWFNNYLRNNKKARESLMEVPSKTKKAIMLYVDFFNLSFGWKTELEN